MTKKLSIVILITGLICCGCTILHKAIPDKLLEQSLISKTANAHRENEATVWRETISNRDFIIDIDSAVDTPTDQNLPAAKASLKRFTLENYSSVFKNILRFNGQLDTQSYALNQLTGDQTKGEFEIESVLPDGERAILFGMEESSECAFSVQNIIQTEDIVLSGDAIMGEPAGTQIGEISMEKDDATELLQGFLRDNGITDMDISSVVPAREVSISSEMPIIISRGYYITFTKKIGSLNTPAHWRYYIHRENEKIAHLAQVPVEQICFYIANQEIRVLLWNNATEPVDIINNNIETIPFSDVRKQAVGYLEARYSSHGDFLRESNQRLIITVSDVKLGICHIGTKEDLSTVYYVPAWYVFYTETYYMAGEIASVLDDYLVICAVDGTQLEPRISRG